MRQNSIKFLNVDKRLLSQTFTYDSENPVKIGNTIHSTYDDCESSRVPLHGKFGEFEFFVTKVMDHTDQRVIMVFKKDNWSAHQWATVEGWNIGLKQLLELIHEYPSETPDTKYIIESDNSIRQVSAARVHRDFTWHAPDRFYTSESDTFGTISAVGGEFLIMEGGFVLSRQNSDFWVESVMESDPDGLVFAEHPYFIGKHKNTKAVFKYSDEMNKWYEYEQEDFIDLDLALEQINKKINSDFCDKIELEEVQNSIVGLALTVEDSYAVGNCKVGTEEFILQHKLQLEDGTYQIQITDENSDFIWNIATQNSQFMRVLKHKVLQLKTIVEEV